MEGEEQTVLEGQLAELKEQNDKLISRIENSSNLIALQRAALYSNSKEIQILQAQLGHREASYQRIYTGLKYLFITKARLTRVRERDKRMYFRLIKHHVKLDEIRKIERADGYNGLRKKLVEVLVYQKFQRKEARGARSAEEQAKVDKEIARKYMKKST